MSKSLAVYIHDVKRRTKLDTAWLALSSPFGDRGGILIVPLRGIHTLNIAVRKAVVP